MCVKEGGRGGGGEGGGGGGGGGKRVQRCIREPPSSLQLSSARQMLMDIGVEI